jgi:hypothetical protein
MSLCVMQKEITMIELLLLYKIQSINGRLKICSEEQPSI